MTEERQPRVVHEAALGHAARAGVPRGVDPATLAFGPRVVRLDAQRIAVAVLAPRGAVPLAIAARLAPDGVVEAVLQPRPTRGEQSTATPWTLELRLPDEAVGASGLPIRVVGLGDALDAGEL